MSKSDESEYKWTNMGWGEAYGPWRYKVLSEETVSKNLPLYAHSQTDPSGGITSVTFQPCLNEDDRSQDRRAVHSWHLRNGIWKFVAVFDGHAGHETVDFAIVDIPLRLKDKLEAMLHGADQISINDISSALANAISEHDEALLADLSSIFPRGLTTALDMSDEELDKIIHGNDRGGHNILKVHRCMRGTTVLMSLVDPSGENLWVASLGDCEAVLGMKAPDGGWAATVLTSNHNAANEAEARRLREAHPGEDKCILHGRVLGAITVTRAVGDFEFKLSKDYTTKIFLNARPGFTVRSRVEEFIQRSLTPPYLTCNADVFHHRIENQLAEGCLIMCSDGLTDLYTHVSNRAESWVNVVGKAIDEGGNPALELLRDALGGDADSVSKHMTLECTEAWIDDTTIAVLKL
ncbi:protein serine threonine phosphatase 2C [Hysterangium stoloniferum]|nr:protein serine threonine phosphatase 2C [Hysterangium stoloniferum]